MPTPRSRKPRFQRVTPAPSIRLTERDFLILDLVSRHRFLRSDHVTALVSGSEQHVIRRLGRLYHAGLLDRPRHQLRLPERPGPIVYCLTERGRKELIAQGKRVFPSPPRMRKAASALRFGHDLRISDVLVAMQTTCSGNDLSFLHHHDWTDLLGGSASGELHPLQWSIRLQQGSERQRLTVIPDAAFAIHDGGEGQAFFLLEVDRGTMPVTRSDPAQTSFIRKVQAYRETRNAGVLWKRWEVPGFRVLVVAESRKRMRSLQRATAECFRYGRSTMFLFAVAKDLLNAAEPLTGSWENCMGDPAILIAQQPTEPSPCQSHPAPVA